MERPYHLKFYADCPDGQPNKFFCYPVHDGKHACDLLGRFLARDFRLRAAFLGEPGALCPKLPETALKWPGSAATISTMLIRFPARSTAPVPTSAELEALLAQFPEMRGALDKLRASA